MNAIERLQPLIIKLSRTFVGILLFSLIFAAFVWVHPDRKIDAANDACWILVFFFSLLFNGVLQGMNV